MSLSPRSVREAEHLERLVLPSPNGASISASLVGAERAVIGACLRNRRAAAALVARRLLTDPTASVLLVSCWRALARRLAPVSEEASAAAAAYRLVEARLGEALVSCSSGRELADGGYAVDAANAAELDESGSVPRLGDGAFVAQ